MRTIRIATKGTRRESAVVCRRNVLSAVLAPMRERLLGGGGIVFTDSNVFAIYREELLRALGGVPVFVMEAGEAHKNEETLLSLLRAMAEAGLRRNSVLIAFGGGVVGDIGGLAASLYMRGIACIQVPTTLLSQVDSSVGGKTAIDFCGVKNLIGAFKQPETVYADPVFLQTLSRRELRCGLGEIVKHGVLSAPLFEELAAAPDLFDLRFLASVVPENIAVKADVVRRDPEERGIRRCLNLGHTTGHAVELSSGLSHGECVLWGLLFESRLAARMHLAEEKFCEALGVLCRTALEGGRAPDPDVRHALLDKKNTEAGTVTLTLPAAVGKYEIVRLPFARYAEEIAAIREELC